MVINYYFYSIINQVLINGDERSIVCSIGFFYYICYIFEHLLGLLYFCALIVFLIHSNFLPYSNQ